MTVTYVVVGSYKGGPLEELDSSTSPVEAAALMYEYQTAFGAGWSIAVKREERNEKLQDDEKALPTHR